MVRRSDRENEPLCKCSVYLPTNICAFNVEVFSHASHFITGKSEFIKPVIKEKSESRENKEVEWAWCFAVMRWIGREVCAIILCGSVATLSLPGHAVTAFAVFAPAWQICLYNTR